MKTLCEYVGRRANREDQCKGRFFEERFSCRRLFNEAAVLVCGIYVDLNQIRAGETLTPEESQHTSAYDRILDLLCEDMFGDSLRIDEPDNLLNKAGWMCELTLQEGPDTDVSGLNCTQSKRRASEKGLLPISLKDYLSLLDWTGKQQRADKIGAIPSEYGDIMDRLRINRSMWMELTHKFDQLFGSLVGNASSIANHIATIGRTRCAGQANCSAAFG